jgi:predicted metalloprotease
MEDLVAKIDGYWDQYFREGGLWYQRPAHAWLNNRGVCGYESVDGALYCRDGSLYFFEEEFQPDFDRRAYSRISIVVAHEWGHHVQHILGIEMSTIAQEHQADCMAGMYFWYARRQGWINDVGIANARAKARVDGDASHGSGAQRVAAFNEGLSGSNCGL